MIGTVQGRGIIQASWIGTAVYAVSAVAAAIFLGSIRYVAVAVALVLFALGCVTFLWAYWIAVQRSRTDEIGIGGLFFLAGKETAPRRVKWLLHGALATQIAVGLLTASLRPFTTLAFGLLVPMFGLGCIGLWGARYGRFGSRVRSVDAPERQEIGQNAPHG
jgi:hypothetical protein